MTHRAPWSNSLRWISTIASTLLISVSTLVGLRTEHSAMGLAIAALPIAIGLGALLWTIRGYRLTPETLLVRRLLWSTKISLGDLDRCWIDPTAMLRSLRLFGNGGLYSFSGVFRNNKLGRFRAFVSDPDRAVVLSIAGHRVVISPESPSDFLRDLQHHFPDVVTTPPEDAPS